TEAKPSETAMEGEGAGSESTMECEATTEAKPSETAMEGEGAGSESTMECKATTEAKSTSKTATEAKAASAEADCGIAVIARVRDTEGAAAGKGRRCQR